MHDVCFIAMSNYYYDEKIDYLESLSESRARGHDITPFLVFSMKGIATQNLRVLDLVKTNVKKELVKNLMNELFDRLETPRKRVIANRQRSIIDYLLSLDTDEVVAVEVIKRLSYLYGKLSNPRKAIIRDLIALNTLGVIKITDVPDRGVMISVQLDWPTKATEMEFMKRIESLPKARTSFKFEET